MPAKPRSTNAPVTVLAVGAGGIEELHDQLHDAMVCWAILRFQVGSGSFARTKFVAIHFNGNGVQAIRRGQLNARSKDILPELGKVHATIEVKSVDDVNVGSLCERLLPFFVSDSGIEGASASAESLRQSYEAQIASRRRLSRKKSSIKSSESLTAKEKSGPIITTDVALKAVSAKHGPFNWLLLEPTELEMHNAGYGGLLEMKTWLADDKVLFGAVRFTFGWIEGSKIVKHIFIHWVGPKTSAVRRSKWNAQKRAATDKVRQHCVLALHKEAHALEDIDLEDLIKELRRLTTLDGMSSEGQGGAEAISVEEYLKALEKEREEQMSIEDTESVEDEEAAPPLPNVKTAVTTVRNEGGGWNWALLGFEGATVPAAGQPLPETKVEEVAPEVEKPDSKTTGIDAGVEVSEDTSQQNDPSSIKALLAEAKEKAAMEKGERERAEIDRKAQEAASIKNLLADAKEKAAVEQAHARAQADAERKEQEVEDARRQEEQSKAQQSLLREAAEAAQKLKEREAAEAAEEERKAKEAADKERTAREAVEAEAAKKAEEAAKAAREADEEERRAREAAEAEAAKRAEETAQAAREAEQQRKAEEAERLAKEAADAEAARAAEAKEQAEREAAAAQKAEEEQKAADERAAQEAATAVALAEKEEAEKAAELAEQERRAEEIDMRLGVSISDAALQEKRKTRALELEEAQRKLEGQIKELEDKRKSKEAIKLAQEEQNEQQMDEIDRRLGISFSEESPPTRKSRKSVSFAADAHESRSSWVAEKTAEQIEQETRDAEFANKLEEMDRRVGVSMSKSTNLPAPAQAAIVEEGPTTWAIELDRAGGEDIGIDLDYTSLRVNVLREEGLVSQWNQANPGLAVRPGDVIISVNGKKGAGVLSECVQRHMLKIVVGRGVEEHKVTCTEYSLVIDSKVQRMGWASSGLPPDRVFVSQVMPSSWGAQKGLKPGDEVISVSGKLVSDMKQQDFLDAVKRRPLHIVFSRTVDSSSSSFAASFSTPSSPANRSPVASSSASVDQPTGATGGVFTLVADEGTGPLGWLSLGLPPQRVFVSEIDEGSWADKCGMRLQDELIRLDDFMISQFTQDAFLKAVSRRPLRFTFMRHQSPMDAQAAAIASARASAASAQALAANPAVRAAAQALAVPDLRYRHIVANMPMWEDWAGELRLRTGWHWRRRYFKLSRSCLRWWASRDDTFKTPPAEPMGKVILVDQTSGSWNVQKLQGTRFELVYEQAPQTRRAAPSVERYQLQADSEQQATECARMIGSHARYIDMLAYWPMPVDGRQSDIRCYGIEYPP